MGRGDSFSRGEKRKRDAKEGSELMGLGATIERLTGASSTTPKPDDGDDDDDDDDDDKTAVQNGKRPLDATNDGGGGGGGGQWQTVERRNKRQKKETANYPAITHSASARLQSFVKIGDLQNLVLYLLADGNGPQWISVRHKKEIERVVCLLVPGLEADMFNGNISLDRPDQDRAEQKKTESTEDETNTSDKPLKKVKLNISPDDYYPTKLVPDKLPAPLVPLADIFPHIWPIKTPGEHNRMHSPLHSMLNAPLPKSKEDKKIKGPKPPIVSRDFQSKRTPVTEYIATKEELADNGFSIHPAYLKTQEERDYEAARRYKACRSPEDGWIDLPPDMTDMTDATVHFSEIEAGSMTAGRNVLFLDCEMVTTTEDRFALARLSLLSWDGEVVMDELVQPPDPVKDYLTQYSGISKEMLDPVTTTLSDMQQKLKTILTPRTILAGHSLDSDLRALKISFPFIIDTTLLYPHPKGAPQKSSLKWLTQKYLSREIQNRGPKGHDSIEDARACLDLVKQKCEKGKSWGTSEATGESIFKRLSRCSNLDDNDNKTAERTSALIDWGDPKKGYGANAHVSIPCENDDDVVAGIRTAILGSAHSSLSDSEISDAVQRDIPQRGVDFIWARLRELEALRGWWNKSKTADATERLARVIQNNDTADSEAVNEDENNKNNTSKLAQAVSSTISKISRIYESLPPKTAFIIYSGSGDPCELRRLQEMHAEFKRQYATKKWDELDVQWTDVEEQKLRNAATKARSGVGFVCVK
ncbi:hypothetical protein AAFC00_006212 [Neodothiora populina]|uniref:Exonuclease domain-containing protein n=1 Tax=Neodothiora populina TaxID=2781224 RepID=A0ABR3P4F8_9PEZI